MPHPPPIDRLLQARGLVLFVALAAGGCAAVGPDYEPPELTTPEAFTAEFERGLSVGDVDLSRWWQALEDPTLDALVLHAREANLDLRVAAARIRESRALLGIRDTLLVPNVDARGGYDRTQVSQETPQGQFGPHVYDTWSAGLDVSWELDVFGGLRREIEAAEADLQATVDEARGVLVSVVAETVLNYVSLRRWQELARIAEANVDLQARTLQLTQNQFESNLVSQLDVAQARSNLELTRSTVAPLHAEARAARNRLAVLLGRFPGELEQQLAQPAPIPGPPAEVLVGVPADLVRRRPDIRRAERALAAQTARIGVAAADLYPRFTLDGSFGYAAQDANDLASDDAFTFGVGPAFRWNLFDRSRVRNAVNAADERQQQALASYERVVLIAFEEVENAMTRFVRDQLSRDALLLAVEASRRAVDLSQDRYRQGLVSFQSVLDTQRGLFEAESQLASRSASITTNLVLLYKALGGGWNASEPTPDDEADDS